MTAALSYCGPPVPPADIWDRWNFDPVVLAALAVGAGAFAVGRRSLKREGGPQAVWFSAGLLALAIAFLSPLCALSVSLFSARAVHHLLIVAVAAPLLCLGLGRRAWPAASPALAGSVHVAAFWLWHWPAAYAAALVDTGIYWLMQATLLLTAMWFWSAVIAVRTLPVLRAGSLVAFAAQMGFLGAILVFARSALYQPHLGTTLPWGMTPLEDQQLAGVAMWVVGSVPYLIAAIAGIGAWLRSADVARAGA